MLYRKHFVYKKQHSSRNTLQSGHRNDLSPPSKCWANNGSLKNQIRSWRVSSNERAIIISQTFIFWKGG